MSGKGLLPGNTFLAATDSALNDPQNAPRCRIISSAAGAERWAYANLDSYGKTLGRSSASRRRSPARSLPTASRSGSRWPRNGGPAAGNGGLYLANGLIRTRLDVKPTFDRRFSVPAAEVTP